MTTRVLWLALLVGASGLVNATADESASHWWALSDRVRGEAPREAGLPAAMAPPAAEPQWDSALEGRRAAFAVAPLRHELLPQDAPPAGAPALGSPSADPLPLDMALRRVPPGRAAERWTLQVMPPGLMYRSYLAGAKEPRFASFWSSDDDLGQTWDTSLGGRLGVVRYGTEDALCPEGWQIDVEGGVQSRLDPSVKSTPLSAADFRVGVPITWAMGHWQFKTGYYHLSSHLGDEYLLAHPDARRINYGRDAIVLGVGCFWSERLRLYGETACALGVSGGAEPWEFQFGADWAPACDTSLRGAPFAAFNAHLREEVHFGGDFVLQAGWAWRRFPRGSLFRIGLQYFNGKSDQYQFFDSSEQRFGWGLWADF